MVNKYLILITIICVLLIIALILGILSFTMSHSSKKENNNSDKKEETPKIVSSHCIEDSEEII